MIGQRSVVLVLLLSLVAGTESKSEKFEPPICKIPRQQLMNTVVYEGNSSSFSNQLEPEGVKWEIIPADIDSSLTSYTIADNYTVEQLFVGSYTLDSTHLNIPEVRFSKNPNPLPTAGLYTVTHKSDGYQSMANLISVLDGPVCLCSRETGSKDAELTCEIQYAVTDKYPNHAKVMWNTDCEEVHDGKQTGNKIFYHLFFAKSRLSVASSEAEKFTCVVTFEAPNRSAPPNMANNAPSFYASCSSKVCVEKEQSQRR